MPSIQATGNNNSFLQSLGSTNAANRSEAEQAQDRFLTLLVTQMKNQDPLNPMDNAQVTSQMAQISTVTGLDKLNNTLQGLSDGFASTQMLQAASMIGRDVLVPGKQITLAQGAARFGVELTQPADNVTVTIRDAAGNAVRTQELGAQPSGTGAFEWDGMNDQGQPMADARYSVEVIAQQGGKALGVDTLAYARVDSVAQDGQDIELELQGMGPIKLSDVRRFN
jgi:flagellar basal-body rod modification protein FlgD